MNDVVVQDTVLEYDDLDRSIGSIVAKEMLVVVLRREVDRGFGGATKSRGRIFDM